MFIISENFVKYIEVGSLGPCRLRSGGKRQKKGGEIGKIAVSEASLVVGRTTAWLASLAHFFFLFFLPTPSFFSFSPNVEPGPQLRGWLYLQGSAAFGFSTGNGVSSKMVPAHTIIIAY